MPNIITNRVSPGVFNVIKDDRVTDYTIINGSIGVSGFGSNHYGIKNNVTGQITWIGSLAKCKKTVNLWVK